MKKFVACIVVVAFAGLMLSSCATVFKGGQSAARLVGVKKGESVEVLKDGAVMPVETRGEEQFVKLPAQSSHVVTVKYKGQEKKLQTTQVLGGGWLVLDLFLSGLVGIIVDAATGNWNELTDLVVEPPVTTPSK
jgi:hypothetical protein